MDDSLFSTEAGRRRLETEIFPDWIPRQRWFGGKARGPQSFRIARQVALEGAWMLGVEVTYAEGAPETYLLPLVVGADSDRALAGLEKGKALLEATYDEEFRAAFFRLMSERGSREPLRGEAGAFLQTAFGQEVVPTSRVLHAEQSNTSLIYGEKLFVKLFRKLVAGVNPDAEMTRYLSEIGGFQNVAAFGGAVEWDSCSVALATAMVANEGDAWTWACAEMEKTMRAEDVFSRGNEASFDGGKLPLIGARQLGVRTGEMHVALARGTGASFSPEPWEQADGATLAKGLRVSSSEVCGILRAKGPSLPRAIQSLAAELAESLPEWERLAAEMEALAVCGLKIRTHGDYHLGQVLRTGDDFIILDFEGEPSRSLAERRAKRSPLRDVAGMLRSFHYAAHHARRACGHQGAEMDALVEDEACRWQTSYLDGWLQAVGDSTLWLADGPSARRLLHALFVEKALYEIRYELNNRPDWVEIPLRGLAAARHENTSIDLPLKGYPSLRRE